MEGNAQMFPYVFAEFMLQAEAYEFPLLYILIILGSGQTLKFFYIAGGCEMVSWGFNLHFSDYRWSGESFLTSIDLSCFLFCKIYSSFALFSVDMPFSCGCRLSLRIRNINLLSACVLNVGSWFCILPFHLICGIF